MGDKDKIPVNLQGIMDDLESGVTKIIKEDDTFKFSCKACGACCTDRDDIILNTVDIFKISRLLNIPSEELIDKYCTYHIGSTSGLPIIMPRFINKRMKGDIHSVCPFLKQNKLTVKEEYLCSIHKAKPYICAIYPLGRITKVDIKINKKTIQYILQPSHCLEGIGQNHTVREWVDSFDMKLHEQLTNEYYEFTFKLTKIIDFGNLDKIEGLNDRIIRMINAALAATLYSNLDTTGNIKEVLDARYKDTLEKMEEFKKVIENITGIKFVGAVYG